MQIQYIQEVLGVQYFINPNHAGDRSNSRSTMDLTMDSTAQLTTGGHLPLLFLSAPLSLDEKEMFHKIITALKLEPKQWLFKELQKENAEPNTLLSQSAQVMVLMGNAKIFANQVHSNTPKRFQIPSLQEMAQNPQLKASAWEKLKQAVLVWQKEYLQQENKQQENLRRENL